MATCKENWASAQTSQTRCPEANGPNGVVCGGGKAPDTQSNISAPSSIIGLGAAVDPTEGLKRRGRNKASANCNSSLMATSSLNVGRVPKE